MPFSSQQQSDIIQALGSLGVRMPCPRCGTNSWGLLDGFINHSISDVPGQIVIGGRTLLTVALLCHRCGFLAEHAAVTLGLVNPATVHPANAQPNRETNAENPASEK